MASLKKTSRLPSQRRLIMMAPLLEIAVIAGLDQAVKRVVLAGAGQTPVRASSGTSEP